MERRAAILSAAGDFGAGVAELGSVAPLWASGGAARIDAEDAAALASEIADRLERLADLVGGQTHAAAKLFDDACRQWRGDLAAALEDGVEIEEALLEAAARIDAEAADDLLETLIGYELLDRDLSSALVDRAPGAERPVSREDLEAALAAATGGAVDPDRAAKQVADLEAKSEDVVAVETAAQQLMDGLRLPGSTEAQAVIELLDALKRLPEKQRARGLGESWQEASRRYRSLADRCRAARRSLTTLEGSATLARDMGGADFDRRLREAAATVKTTGLIGRLGGRYRAAYAFGAELFPQADNRERLAQRLEQAARVAADVQALLRECAKAEPDLPVNPLSGQAGPIQDAESFLSAVERLDGRLPGALLDAAVRQPAVVLTFLAGRAPQVATLARLDAAEQSRRAHEARVAKAKDAQQRAAAAARLFRDAPPISASGIERLLETMAERDEIASNLDKHPAVGKLGPLYRGVATDQAALKAVVDLATSRPGAAAMAAMTQSAANGTLVQALELAAEIDVELERLRGCAQLEAGFAAAYGLASLIAALREAAADVDGLVRMNAVRRGRERLAAEDLDQLAVACQTGAIAAAGFAEVVEAVMARAMSRDVWRMNPELEGYDGRKLDQLRQDIARFDRDLIERGAASLKQRLYQFEWGPAGSRRGPKREWTDRALIENEMMKQKRWISVRDLTRRAGEALSELKPCWLMSPLAVAQYLSPDDLFDLVIIDEASQMTPQFALGAISRAKQVVVVGDTKQLPPTSFFQGGAEADEEDEDLGTDNESILEIANAAYQPVRQLRWHYRSRDARLIATSNRWMYNDNLVVFPNAAEDNPRLGLAHVEVDGVYASGVNRREAEAVIRAIADFMAASPDRSLAVVTMNSKQSDLLQEEFASLIARDPVVAAYVDLWREKDGGVEEFVIKNLENIQGDERDVIFISTVYGPISAGGKVPQRFGPVNQRTGARRLNVLFSRAKEQVVTFTSLRPADINIGDGKSTGVRMLRAWLEYSGTGLLPGTERRAGEPDNPFEEHVIAQISAMGFEAVPQVGAAGYFIDIGVRDPSLGMSFILGVECDGASYHSSRSSRERDRLRQQVLEGLGWRFHRIWSTDWFNDPVRETARLREAIESRVAEVQAERKGRSEVRHVDYGRYRGAATHPVDAPAAAAEAPIPAPAPPPAPEAAPTIRATDNASDATNRARVGSEITVIDEKGIESVFVLTENRAMPEIGFISVQSPFGRALRGKAVGDEVVFKAPSGERRMMVTAVVTDGMDERMFGRAQAV